MAPRLMVAFRAGRWCCSQAVNNLRTSSKCHRAQSYASVAMAEESINRLDSHILLSQPPSHRKVDSRKSQQIRQYMSLLRNTPMMLIFQHNSLLATEFTAIRTVLRTAMQKVDQAQGTQYADYIKLQVVKASLVDAALRLHQFWQPASGQQDHCESSHALSEEAYQVAFSDKSRKHGLETLLSGPICILSIPWMSPEHLSVVLSLLAPSPDFPAPKRRANPAYYEPPVQNGLPKLLCLGGRIESQALDVNKVRWVGGFSGGLSGLQAQLIAMLQGVGAEMVHALGSTTQNIYSTLHSRKEMLEK